MKTKIRKARLLLSAWVLIVGITSALFVLDDRPEALGWYILFCVEVVFVSGLVTVILRKGK